MKHDTTRSFPTRFGFGLLAALAATAPSGSFGDAAPVGFARSEKTFSIVRGEVASPARAGALAALSSGDVLDAADAHVRVTTEAGGALLLQTRSRAEFPSPEVVRLVSGECLVSATGASVPAVDAGGLSVRAIALRDADANGAEAPPHMAAVARPAADAVVVAGFAREFAVRGEDGRQLGVVGPRDRMTFLKREEGWVLAQAETDAVAPADDAATETSDEGEIGEDEAGSRKRRRGGFLGWLNPSESAGSVGAAAAAAPVGSFVGLSPLSLLSLGSAAAVGATVGTTTQLTKKDEDERPAGEEQQPSSPVAPDEQAN